MAATEASNAVPRVGTAHPVPEAKKRRVERFAVCSYFYVAGDIVWVKVKGHPLWPAEVEEALNSNTFRCKLIEPPPAHAAAPVFPTVHGGDLQFFDKLRTESECAATVEARLQRDRHDVSAYVDSFVRAVEAANRLVRIVLNPDRLVETCAAQASPDDPSVVCVPVGVVHSFHRTHASAPRQPHVAGVVAQPAAIVLRTDLANAARDLKGFERVWIVFHFSYATGVHPERSGVATQKKTMVVPPRDTVQRGVFATRSPHRPNGIGLSCVRLVDVRGLVIHIADHDLLHGTPVLDIKPYLPFCDAHPDAEAGWVDDLDASGKSLGDHRKVDANRPVHRNIDSPPRTPLPSEAPDSSAKPDVADAR